MESRRTLTLVKTDIRRFTDRVSTMSAPELDVFLRQHRAVVEPVLQAHGGRIIKEIGDSYLAAFESSTDAVLAAIEAQRNLALHESSRAPEDRVEIRIAIHAGDVLLQGGDVFGTPVNAVARLEAIVPPGEVYVSEAVRLNLNPSEVACERVGSFQLKGLSEPIEVYRTTFHHQTRVVADAVVLVCDVQGFTSFAEGAPLSEVEEVLEAWDLAQREAVVAAGGVVRATLADFYMSLFEDPDAALTAWHGIASRVAERNLRGKHALRFSSGISAGEIRVFRTALYGRPTGQATLCERVARDCTRDSDVAAVVLPRALMDRVSPESRSRPSLEEFPVTAAQAERRIALQPNAFERRETELVALRFVR